MRFRKHDYVNDAIGRRTSVKNSGTAFNPVGNQFNLYKYNTRSELTNAVRYFGNDIGVTTNPVLGQAYGYAFDNIGNRISALEGTEPTEPSDYTANNLNQYVEREVADVIEVLGSVNTGTTVTVNNQAVTRQGDHYWHKGLDITNSSSAVYEGVAVVGVYNPPGTNDPDVVTVESGNVFVAETPEGFTYDDDGNLTGDGRWEYTWNSENRLTQVETAEGVTNVAPRVKLVFEYDYMGRRISKSVMTWDGSSWETNSVRRFVYDGWLMIRELVTCDLSPVTNQYVWGMDLSGSLQGAGGIGGLLTAQLYNPITSNSTTVLYCYDANGNVGQLVDDTGTNVLAHYEYSPFGKAVVATGPLTEVNAIRFSTKFWDEETGLGYWGYRYYHPDEGRWLNRDPIDDSGFELAANKPRIGKKTPEIERLKRFRDLLFMINPTLAIRIQSHLERINMNSGLQADQDILSPYAFVRNDPSDSVDYQGLSLSSFKDCVKSGFDEGGVDYNHCSLGILFLCVTGCGFASGGTAVIPCAVGCTAVSFGSVAAGIVVECLLQW